MKLSHWLFTLIAFFIIAVIIYSPSLSGPWQYDDYAQILDNKVLTGRPLPKLLSSIFRFTAHPDGWTGTRDLVRATFLLNWQWWGERPLGYRWVNLSIHVINATLVAALVWNMFYVLCNMSYVTDKNKKREFSSTHNTYSILHIPYYISIFAGLLFLVHPLNSQAVAYVAQRFTSVAAMFYLAAIICWLTSLRKWNMYYVLCNMSYVKDKNKSHHTYYISHITYYILSLLFALLAYNSKEISVTLPAALVAVTIAKIANNSENRERTGSRSSLNFASFAMLIPFFLLALKIPLQTATAAAAGGEAAVTPSFPSDPSVPSPRIKIDLDAFALRQKDDLLSRRDYFLTQISVVATYLRLAVLPINQTLDYDYPITRTPDPKTLALAGFHLSLIGLGSWLLLRSLRNFSPRSDVSQTSAIRSFVYSFIRLFRYFPPSNPSVPSHLPLIGFGILWFYLTLLPESSVIPIPDVIYEHRAYLPLVGLILAAAAAIAAALHRTHESHETHKSHVSYVAVAAAILLILAAATLRRASIWGNEVRLWADVYANAPQKPRAVKNYGVVLAAAGKYDDGIKLLETAVKLDPDNADYWSNLGTANLRAGRYDQAKDKFLTAYQLLAAELGLPSYENLSDLSNLSILSNLTPKTQKQAAQYLNDYGVCLVQLGRGEEALPAFQKSLAIDPGLYAARLGLGAAYNLMGNTQKAIDVFEAAVEEFPDLPDAYNNLAVMYKKAGRLEDHDRIIKAVPKPLKKLK